MEIIHHDVQHYSMFLLFPEVQLLLLSSTNGESYCNIVQ